jgi:hypothetical protein
VWIIEKHSLIRGTESAVMYIMCHILDWRKSKFNLHDVCGLYIHDALVRGFCVT